MKLSGAIADELRLTPISGPPHASDVMGELDRKCDHVWHAWSASQ